MQYKEHKQTEQIFAGSTVVEIFLTHGSAHTRFPIATNYKVEFSRGGNHRSGQHTGVHGMNLTLGKPPSASWGRPAR